jgi:streptogramin lyase
MRWVVLFVVAVMAALSVSGASGSAGSGQARWVIRDLETLGGRPSEIVAGPDGALWFTNYGQDSIGRITTGGKVSLFR